MSLATTSDGVRDKRARIKELREKHQPTFDRMGIPEARFVPKSPYFPSGQDEKIIAFFPSEINKGDDVYTEFVSRDLDPEDPKRTLWRWKFNPFFETEYEKAESHGGRDPRYYIPVKELIEVTDEYELPMNLDEIASKEESKQIQIPFSLPNPAQDSPLDQITIRDLAAIMLRIPVSQKEWLNDIVKQTQPKK